MWLLMICTDTQCIYEIHTVKIKPIQREKNMYWCDWLIWQKFRIIFVLILHHILILQILKFSPGKETVISNNFHLGN